MKIAAADHGRPGACHMAGLALLSLLSLIGCDVLPVKPDDPAYAPVSPDRLVPVSQVNGAIYQEGQMVQLFGDRRAQRVGDVVTILLTENTASKKSAQTSTKKDDSATLANPLLFGHGVSIQGNDLSASLDAKRKFDGQGSSDQSNSLSGSITVTVVNVLPNGLLEVRGEKWISLNRGDEYVRIRGLLRSEDISTSNTIPSTKLANARISYGGTGEVADASAMGWLARFFNSPIWPF